jgi:membrane protein
MLLWTIEATLNQIWRIEKPRSMRTRVLIYWTVLTLGPLLLGASFVLTSSTFTTLSQWARDGVGVVRSQDTLPIISLIFAFLTQFLTFTLLFKLVPARPVQLRDAAVGGFIAGAGVQILRWSFDSFLSRGSTYETIYGAVAILPIFLFWLYLSWIVVILGAVFAASLPEWRKPHNSEFKEDFSQSQKLRTAVAALRVLAQQARQGQTTALPELQDRALLDMRDELFEALLRAGYIVVTENDRISLLRDLHITTVADLARDLNLVIGLPAEEARQGDDTPAPDALSDMLRELHNAETAILSKTLAQLIFKD